MFKMTEGRSSEDLCLDQRVHSNAYPYEMLLDVKHRIQSRPTFNLCHSKQGASRCIIFFGEKRETEQYPTMEYDPDGVNGCMYQTDYHSELIGGLGFDGF